jgi:[ribosomal protein S5]-alanine N-acetyltransferase
VAVTIASKEVEPSMREPALHAVAGPAAPADLEVMTFNVRYASASRADGEVIGGATLLPLPLDEEYEMGWQLDPRAWGRGYATEAGLALARWAFDEHLDQVIALVRPSNTRAAATARRIGMEWVGETEKYHHLRMQEYRLRPGDLVPPGG